MHELLRWVWASVSISIHCFDITFGSCLVLGLGHQYTLLCVIKHWSLGLGLGQTLHLVIYLASVCYLSLHYTELRRQIYVKLITFTVQNNTSFQLGSV